MIKNAAALRRVGRIAIHTFLVLTLMLGYMAQATLTAHAKKIIPDAINTNSNTSVVNNAPQYTGRGVQESIAQYLCVPEEESTGTVLYACITKLYRFSIAFGAIALVFFVVFAGYMYMAGGETGKTKGKDILLSAITGMAVILSSYVLLRFINPSLVQIRPIQPPIFSASNLLKCEDVGLGVNCVLPSGQIKYAGGEAPGEQGQCTAANLSQCSKWKVNEAIAVCNIESKGYNKAKSGTDLCDNIRGPDGDYLSFSYGIMQVSLKSMGETFPQCVNILNYPEGEALRQPGNCPGGFKTAQNGTSYCARRKCTAPQGEAKLKECANLLFDVANNVKASCTLYGKTCWAPWPDTGKVVPNYKQCPRP